MKRNQMKKFLAKVAIVLASFELFVLCCVLLVNFPLPVFIITMFLFAIFVIATC